MDAQAGQTSHQDYTSQASTQQAAFLVQSASSLLCNLILLPDDADAIQPLHTKKLFPEVPAALLG